MLERELISCCDPISVKVHLIFMLKDSDSPSLLAFSVSLICYRKVTKTEKSAFSEVYVV